MKLKTMALVSCPECQHEVSSLALACPQCAYPQPGKQGTSEEKLQACLECGGVVSKKAKFCPHCGISCINASENTPVIAESKDESWLCPHCGIPYTRKVRIPAGPIPNTETRETDHQEPQINEEQEIRKPSGSLPRAENQQSIDQKPHVADEQEMSFLHKMGAAAPPPPGRHPSPLWFPSSPPQNLGSSPSRQRKKGFIVVGIALVLLIVLSIMLWVVGEPNGTNPLDVLGISTWSMNTEPPIVPEGTR